jgi:long-subunit acyl-CoA synthetase (AMP-forming)
LTGDVAELRDGRVAIIDRKKNFFKLANGKFVRVTREGASEEGEGLMNISVSTWRTCT